ncbi:MAG: InlB B-repeat-containing protein [Clostridia bacterium]|nr:InlB B-repeat-containing protein [Clostridia bacterium]
MGGSAIEPIKIADNETPNIFQTTQKSGLEFGGWYTDAEYKNKYEARPMNGDLTLYVRWLKRVHIEAEQFDKYIDVIFTHEKKESVIELKLTVSLKEEYRKYTVFVAAHWQVDYQKTDGSVGNELFKKATRIDTENDIFDTTEILESSRSFDATSWELNIINSAAYMLVPENELQAK